MKHKFSKFIVAFTIAVGSIGWTSCGSDDPDIPQSYQLTIDFSYKDDLAAENISDLKVIATNDKGVTDTIPVNGTSVTATVIEGQYKLTATGSVKDEYATASGTASIDVYGGNASVTVELYKIKSKPIIFKAIYTTGGAKSYMVDSYFELVNNTDEVQYLDQLILSSPTGDQKAANSWQAAGITDLYNCGQGLVIAFPGSGKDYPLQPGQSIVLANNATNHKELAPAGNNCPDLSNADWEIVIPNTKKGDPDYPAPNVEVIFQNNTSMVAFGLGTFARAYLIAHCPEGVTPQEFAADLANIQTMPGLTATREYLMVPSKYVIDAVDMWRSNKSEYYPTFLPQDDAQGVIASNTWEGKCIRRKVTKIENGRAYYQDTNNSSNDFLNNQPLTPGQAPTQVDE